MIRAFFLSLRLYIRWFLKALGPDGRRLAPLTIRRLLALSLLFPLFLLFQTVHWLGFLCDELFFRGYRRVPISEPLFISGIPRSGTTFLHRILARDDASFTTFRTWEALFAPSITQRKLIAGFGRLDGLIGRPLERLITGLTRWITGDFAHIHEIGLQAAEEDYLALLPVGGCFVLTLAFPASRDLWQLGRFGELPENQRRILLDFYQACLQKHLYVTGPGRRLLSKNAAFGSWLPELAQRFPDARFLVCLREPRTALRSQTSSLRDGLEALGTLPAGDRIQEEFQANFNHVYPLLLELQRKLSVQRLAVLDYDRLKCETAVRIEDCLRQLGVPVTGTLRQALIDAERETKNYVSAHRHAAPAADPVPSETEARWSRFHAEIIASRPPDEWCQ